MKKAIVTFGAYALLTAAACGASFFYGKAYQSNSQLQSSFDAAVAAQRATITEVSHSATVSASVDAKAAASSSFTQAASQVVAERLADNEPKVIYRTKVVKEQCTDESLSASTVRSESDFSVAPWRFDVGTVRLLNAARGHGSVDPASIGNDPRDNTPSDVGIGEFTENDLQLAKRYQQLKDKHDALVDWIERQQANGYGLCVAAKINHEVAPLEDP